MTKVPSPETNTLERLIDPIERKAESWIMEKLRQYFGVRAIRAYFTMIFFSYMLDQVSINFIERKFKFEINNQQEFTLYSAIYIAVITILSILDYFESRFFAELQLNQKMWENYVQNIQPSISDPDMKLLAMYSFKLEKTKKDLRDYFIKVVDQHIKTLLEQVSDLEFANLALRQELEELAPLKKLAKQIREKQRKREN